LFRTKIFQFPQYSYREFFKRRIRDHFAAAVKNENIQQTEFYEKCQDLLKVIRRQSALHRFYPTSKLVIEEEKEGKETNQNS
uniref:Complex1_LYR_dom domain-containing protein n=1 Tax=Gongylonema pulchrum TaxID=637853 RepID=A0A183CV29_9BILA